MRPVIIIPAYNAARTVGDVATELRRAWADATGAPFLRRMADALGVVLESALPILVVDDGSSDGTHAVLVDSGVTVVRHEKNCGKGAALRTGLRTALGMGFDTATTIDADGQHRAADAINVLLADSDPDTFVLGVRDMRAVGAPLPNRLGNGLANFWLSVLTLHRFHDTQCGLRRYPIAATLALGARDSHFGYESEVILRAARAGMSVHEISVRCAYESQGRQSTHYRPFLDTAAILVRLHVAYLFPWIRLPRSGDRVSLPPVSVSMGERARRIGTYWAAIVVLVLVTLVFRAAICWATKGH